MIKVCALGIEPASPATGGSRLRVNGLYQNLSKQFDVRYVGAFHWRGENSRRLQHRDRFVELTIPFSDNHLNAIEKLAKIAGHPSLIDASFARFAYLSEELTNQAISMLEQADVVILSHPWMHAIAAKAIDSSRQLVIYDAHNVEQVLHSTLLSASPARTELLAEITTLERELCQGADWVVCCSEYDRQQLVSLYQISREKVDVMPNGVDPHLRVGAPDVSLVEIIAQTNQDASVTALFIGGDFKPNREAVDFIIQTLAPRCPDVCFIVAGQVSNSFQTERKIDALPSNVVMTGSVSETDKNWLLSLVDLGLNPIFSGSGSNVKMFDYFAAGLAVISTPFGARGISQTRGFMCVEAEHFHSQLESLMHDKAQRIALGRQARELAVEHYSWSTISAEFAIGIEQRWLQKCAKAKPSPVERPLFSITIPTLNRPATLRRLLDLLTLQTEQDFEVIVVDQSDQAFDPRPFLDYLNIKVIHSEVKGACRARNLAVSHAQGKYLVFTDDDCEPSERWLAEAKTTLGVHGVVGLEGRIISDRLAEEEWRSVHNHGSESLGFMTCNLFCTAEAFATLGGFDTRFDLHDFRYDTDFGWRLQDLGAVPFSEQAWVFHPPWSRSIARESSVARNRMFRADALLMLKHPTRYHELFVREQHYNSHAFWPPLLAGIEQLGTRLPEYAQQAYDNLSASPQNLAPSSMPNQRYAYAFYATSDSYAAAVLIAATRLKRFSDRQDIDYVVIVHNVSQALLTAMKAHGLIIKHSAALVIPGQTFYQFCLTKLRIFQLFGYQRVVYLDADCLILKSLDSLFDLAASVKIAAPKAYWLEQPWVSSMLMVITPSPTLWERVANHVNTAQNVAYFDMEIINYEFAEELHYLDDIYGCINDEWDGRRQQHHFAQDSASQDAIPIVHFSSIGKPWELSLADVEQRLPNAEPKFFELWQTWQKEFKRLFKDA